MNSTRGRSLIRGSLAAGTSVLVLAALVAPTTAALGSGARSGAMRAPHADATTATRTSIMRVGVTHPTQLGKAQGTSRAPHQLPLLRPTQGAGKGGAVPVVRQPAKLVKGSLAKDNNPGTVLQNFDGINGIQNTSTAFPLEPPDEGLGAGNGFVANFVNVTGGIYSTDGSLLEGPFYLNSFFGEPDAANTSDPRVFYDSSTSTWFASILEYGISDQGTISESHVDVAVSQSADPTGAWTLYQIPTSNDSNPSHFHCPCLADYPILGVDRQNIYISTNEFTTDESAFNGAQLYALSKSQLIAGQSSVNGVYFQNLSMAGAPAFHVQPANEYGSSKAEWLMNSLDPNNTSDHRIGVWAVTNESSVTTGQGMPTLSSRVVHSESYAFPPNAKTPKGFCSNCDSGNGQPTTGIVQTDWDAMQETQYINGQLVGALNTGVNIPGDSSERSGVAWFVVHPRLNGSTVSSDTKVARQNYVAVQGEYLLYPHINMTGSGAMALTFGLGGPKTYLSAAWSVARNGRSFKIVKLAGPGTGPDNGFTGAPQYGGANRWGDYSNGQIVPGTNKVWLATQYIPNSGDGYTNWGNRVFELKLP